MRSDFARKLFRLCYGYTFYLILMELMVHTMGDQEISWLVLLTMLCIYVGNYVLRGLIQHIWPLIVYTAAVDAAVWFLLPADNLQCTLLMGLATGLMFTGFHYVRSGGILPEPMDVPWPIFVMGLLATVFGLIYDKPMLVVNAAVLTGIALCFFLLILYTDSLRKYADSTKDVKGIPIRQILKINTWIIVVIFLCMVVAIGLGEALHLPDALAQLGSAFVSILKTLFFGVVLVFHWMGELFKFSSHQSVQETAQKFTNELNQGHAFANVLEVVLKILLLVLVLFILIRILSRVIRSLSARYRKEGTVQVVETKRTDLRTRIENRSPLDRFRKYMSMEERARRIYRKKILECRKDGIPSETETTADILEILRTDEGLELSELTELYDRVRYGGIVPDRAYLARMKKSANMKKPKDKTEVNAL